MLGRSRTATIPKLQQQIQSWQQPILDREDLPWFKMALFNELRPYWRRHTLDAADMPRSLGGLRSKCIDYRWYESLDVRLYGSFALLMLAKLDKAVLRAYARAIQRRSHPAKLAITRLPLRKLPMHHPTGAPNEHPWEQNYTSYQDCNLWKDLPCDFVCLYRFCSNRRN